MINRLKVMELVRYNINTNLNTLQERTTRENNEMTENTVSAVFATGFSLIASQLGQSLYSWIKEGIKAPSWFLKTSSSFQIFFHSCLEGIIVFVLFVAFFSASFFAFRHFWKKIKKKLYASKCAPANRPLNEYKKIIDDFDHIACDAILFSQYFISAYQSRKKAQLTSTSFTEEKLSAQTIHREGSRFNVYEAIYYLKKAEQLTLEVFLHGDSCINSMNNVDRIAIHRLENMVLLMEAVWDELKVIINDENNKMSHISLNSLNRDYLAVEERTKDLREKLNILLDTPTKPEQSAGSIA